MTKGDRILIILVLLISIGSLGFISRKSIGMENKYISIQVNGVEEKKIIFDKKIIGNTISMETEWGFNLIEIGDEKVRIIDASCPDKLDVKQGYISRPGEVIVCLPNRLVVEIKNLKEEYNEIDIINQ